MRRHEVSQRPLQWRDAGKADVLMHLAQFAAERRRRHHVTGLPAGDVIGLAERADDEGTLIQLLVAQHAGVLPAVEYQVLVNLVAEQVDVALADQCRQPFQIAAIDQCTAGIVRGVEHDHPRARGYSVGQALPVDPKVRQAQLLVDTGAPGQLHGRLVTVVAGIEHDHLVAWADHCLDRAEDRLGGARGDGDFAGDVHLPSVQAGHLGRHLLAQRRQAGHRGVLVVARHDVPRKGFAQRLGTIEVGKALGEIQGTGVGSELRHGGEDGRADIGQFTGEHDDRPTGLPFESRQRRPTG